MATRTLTVKLVGDAKSLNNAFQGAGSKAASFGKTIGKIGLAAGAGFVGAAAAAKPLIDKASDLNEEISKSEAVFGAASKGVGDFAKAADKNLGLSQRAALESLNKFGQFGKAAGLTGKDLGAFGTDLATLSADLASFNNLEVEDAAAKLAAGLSGESEPLKALGIFINAAAVDAKGLELGLGDVNGKLTDQEKIMARQALIFEQTSDAQGDFARTSDGLANKQRILAARFENVQAQLGQKLLPVALKVADALLVGFDKVGPIVKKFVDIFKKDGVGGLLDVIRDAWPRIRDQLKTWGEAFIEWVKDVAPPLFKSLLDLIGKLTDWIKDDGLAKISAKLIEWAEAFVRWVAPLIPPLLVELGKLALAILDWAAFDLAPQLIRALARLARDAFKAMLSSAQGLWNREIKPWLGTLPGLAMDALSGLASMMYNLGVEIIEKLWDGARDKIGGFFDWLGDQAGNIVDAINPFNDGAPADVWRDIAEGGGGGGSADPRVAQPSGLSGSLSSGMLLGSNFATRAMRDASRTIVIQTMLDGRIVAETVASESQRAGGLPFKVTNSR